MQLTPRLTDTLARALAELITREQAGLQHATNIAAREQRSFDVDVKIKLTPTTGTYDVQLRYDRPVFVDAAGTVEAEPK